MGRVSRITELIMAMVKEYCDKKQRDHVTKQSYMPMIHLMCYFLGSFFVLIIRIFNWYIRYIIGILHILKD